MYHKKILAAKILKTSPYKIKFDEESLGDIKKAITRSDIRGLIAVNKIKEDHSNQHSRSGARKLASQRRKGRKKKVKKGGSNSVTTKKERWINKIRVQRELLKKMRDSGLLLRNDYRQLYYKSKGGYFRNKRHLKLYLTEQKLLQKSVFGKDLKESKLKA